jgi:hypothetical protein
VDQQKRWPAIGDGGAREHRMAREAAHLTAVDPGLQPG